MRAVRVLAILCLVLSVPACSSNNKNKIVGKWRSENGQLPYNGVMTLDFAKDNRVTITISAASMSKTITGKYKLGAMDFVSFSDLSDPVAGRRTHSETIAITGNTLTMKDFDGTTLRFARY